MIVLDGCGAGEAPDAAQFGDLDHPATIRHVWEHVGGFDAPNLAASGFLVACGIGSVRQGRPGRHGSRWGRLREVSLGGKDSVTGHWEMAGIVTKKPFPTYPKGFPPRVIEQFQREIGREVLGNRPESGTVIIQELGEEHMATGKPIVYTSADSVFQIACHESVVPLKGLYAMCLKARSLLVAPDDVERVIARPFTGDAASGFRRTENRKDFPLHPPPNLCDVVGDVFGIGVVPELFAGRGFRKERRTQSNAEHAALLNEALESDARFIWANFEDFDMLYGHRNDPIGFAKALEAFDVVLGALLSKLKNDDILILTADHGNDPTTPSTDHSREYVPAVVIGPRVATAVLGDVRGMTAIGATVARHIGIPWNVGTPLL